MRRRLPAWLRWALGALLAVVVLAAATVRWAEERFLSPAALSARLSQAAGRAITVGRAEIELRPGVRVRLEELTVEPEVEIEELEVGLLDHELLRGNIEPESVDVGGVRIALTRHEDGRIGLGDEPPAPSDGDASPLPFLPRVELHRVRVEWLDRTRPDPVAVPLDVERLELRGLGSELPARVAVRAQVAPDGGRGSVEVEAEIGPLGDTDDWETAPGFLQARIESLDPSLVRPYVPESWKLDELEGTLAGELEARAPGGGDLDGVARVSLKPGSLELGGLRVADGLEVTAELARRDGAHAVRNCRVQADRLLFGQLGARRVDATFHWEDGAFALDDLEFEAATGIWQVLGAGVWSVLGDDGEEVPLRVDLNLGDDGLIAIRDARLYRREAGGVIRLPEIPRVELRDVEVVAAAPGVTAEAVRLHVRRLDVTDLVEGGTAGFEAEIHHLHPSGNGRHQVNGALGPVTTRGGVSVGKVDLTSEFENIPLGRWAPHLPPAWRVDSGSGRLHGSASYRSRGRKTPIGEIEFALDGGIEIDGWDFENPRATVHVRGNRIVLDPLELEAYGGRLTSAGRLRLEDGLHLDLHAEASHVDLIRAAARRAEATEEPLWMDAQVRAEGRWQGGPGWLEPFRGRGQLRGTGGRLPGFNLMISVGTALLRLVPGVGQVVPRSRGNVEPSHIESVAASFTIDGGKLHTEDLRMVTDDFEVTAAGSLDGQWQARLRGEASLTRQGAKKTLGMLSVAPGVARAGATPWVPVRLRGHVADPRVRADASSIPAATLRGLGSATRGAAGRLLFPRRSQEDAPPDLPR